MKRTRLKPISDKRKAALAKYSKLRRQYLDEHPICEVCKRKRSYEIHHKNGRYGRWLLDSDYFSAVCCSCHRELHAKPKLAREKGFLL